MKPKTMEHAVMDWNLNLKMLQQQKSQTTSTDCLRSIINEANVCILNFRAACQVLNTWTPQVHRRGMSTVPRTRSKQEEQNWVSTFLRSENLRCVETTVSFKSELKTITIVYCSFSIKIQFWGYFLMTPEPLVWKK